MPKRVRTPSSSPERRNDSIESRKLASAVAQPMQPNIAAARMAKLQWFGVPATILNMIATLPMEEPHLCCAEFFAGVGSIAFGFRSFGKQAAAVDKNYHVDMDLNNLKGIALAIWVIMRTVASGIVWLAPPCSSWIFLSTGTTKRSRLSPNGDTGNTKVLWNNALVWRVSILVEICALFAIYVILEQPTSSLMFVYERMRLALTRVKSQGTHTYMGAFGGDTAKGM